MVHVRRPPVRARTRRAAPTPLTVGPGARGQRELRQLASDLESVGRKIEPEAAKQIRQTIVPKLRAAIKASAASTLPNVAALPLRPRKRPAPPLSATPARASYASAPQTPTTPTDLTGASSGIRCTPDQIRPVMDGRGSAKPSSLAGGPNQSTTTKPPLCRQSMMRSARSSNRSTSTEFRERDKII